MSDLAKKAAQDFKKIIDRDFRDVTFTNPDGLSFTTKAQVTRIDGRQDLQTYTMVLGASIYITIPYSSIPVGFDMPVEGWEIATQDSNGNSIGILITDPDDQDQTLGFLSYTGEIFKVITTPP